MPHKIIDDLLNDINYVTNRIEKFKTKYPSLLVFRDQVKEHLTQLINLSNELKQILSSDKDPQKLLNKKLQIVSGLDTITQHYDALFVLTSYHIRTPTWEKTKSQPLADELEVIVNDLVKQKALLQTGIYEAKKNLSSIKQQAEREKLAKGGMPIEVIVNMHERNLQIKEYFDTVNSLPDLNDILASLEKIKEQLNSYAEKDLPVYKPEEEVKKGPEITAAELVSMQQELVINTAIQKKRSQSSPPVSPVSEKNPSEKTPLSARPRSKTVSTLLQKLGISKKEGAKQSTSPSTDTPLSPKTKACSSKKANVSSPQLVFMEELQERMSKTKENPKEQSSSSFDSNFRPK